MSGSKGLTKDSILSNGGAVLVIFVVFFIGSLYGMFYQSQISSEHINEYFDILYGTEIYPYGEEEIENFISTLPSNESERERLERIAFWVSSNFTNPYWEANILGNSEYDYSDFGPGMSRYVYDPSGKLRVHYEGPYLDNPQWIAYYRTGACGELAALFADIVNRTGNPTNVVIAKYADGRNHAWVEIIRDTGELWYFDPTRYGEYELFNKGEYGAWTGRVTSFTMPWGVEVDGIYDHDTHKDVTDHYPLVALNRDKPTNNKIEPKNPSIFKHVDMINTYISEGIPCLNFRNNC